ncbi:MAG: hypothetical protein E7117_10250 [Bacteroidales bacterium]|nr:hypothetical protein [Bacteroidales bacterium]
MKTQILSIASLIIIAIAGCSKSDVTPSGNDNPDYGFTEAIPDTIRFTTAEFIYNGDDIGEAYSDGWVIKFLTEMEIDEAGSPVGPGSVMQLLLNARYDENQNGDAGYLVGKYTEMMNSGNFAPGTFVSGYIQYIDLPGERIEMPDATFYADIAENSTEMEHDLIDEGVVSISEEKDGSYTITGILVGEKFTKRYFTWNGNIEVENNVPEVIPNSTLESDMIDLDFSRCQLQDKGDSFYLMDQSYRCLLIYLMDDTVETTISRPAGNGRVLRLEILVPWETDYTKGIPEGEYAMVRRNADTSIDKDKIIPGSAVSGLPDVFAAWKVSGSWYYELEGGEWTKSYARIDDGTISVVHNADGSQTISYDLLDCQASPKKITGSSTIKTYE